MLLNGLSHEEKIAFWNIANVLAAVDGNISEEESILKQYSDEMGVDFKFIDDPSAVDIKSELDILKTGNLKNYWMNMTICNFLILKKVKN